MIKYIFTISTGRTGTHYLSKLFQHIDGIKSYHEPIPIMHAKAMRQFLKGKTKLMEKKMPEKIDAINKLSEDAEVYFESNHMFIKGFGWYIPDYINPEEIGVLVITRKKEEIVASHIKLDATPLHYKGWDWTITPLVDHNLAEFPKEFKFQKFLYYLYFLQLKTIYRPWVNKLFGRQEDFKPEYIKKYEKAMLDWYIDETFKRGEQYFKTYPDIKHLEFDITELNDPKTIEKIIKDFNLNVKIKPSFYEALNKRTNLDPYAKNKLKIA